MVAISLYRGELHRVPSVPRRWPIPPRAITLRQFKLLRDKRSEALARLFPDPIPSDPPDAAEVPSVPSGSHLSCGNGCGPIPKDGNVKKPGLSGDEESDAKRVKQVDMGLTSNGGVTLMKVGQADEEEGQGGSVLNSEERPGSPPASRSGVPERVNGTDSEVDAKLQEHNLEGKKELEKKLDMLNEKKHHLVQMLRQVLNAEEEMKRRISMQPSTVRASISPGTVDTGSIANHGTTKLSIDVNCGEQGETDFVDPNAPVRQVSPSPRAIYAASGNASAISTASGNMSTISPRFVPGQLGYSPGLPSPSLSGAHFVASTPSPAASRAFSSVFRDANLTSP